MNKFTELQQKTGTSNQGIARLLNVRVDTVNNWKHDKCSVPEGVMDYMEAYAKSAREIFDD